MIYEDSIQCPECDSYHTKWSNDLRCFICGSCGKYIKLEDRFNDEKIKKAHDHLMEDKLNIMPGDMVMAYDHLKKRMRKAKVIKRYGIVAHKEGRLFIWPEQDVCDIDFVGGFIGESGLSKGHFTHGLEKV